MACPDLSKKRRSSILSHVSGIHLQSASSKTSVRDEDLPDSFKEAVFQVHPALVSKGYEIRSTVILKSAD